MNPKETIDRFLENMEHHARAQGFGPPWEPWNEGVARLTAIFRLALEQRDRLACEHAGGLDMELDACNEAIANKIDGAK